MKKVNQKRTIRKVISWTEALSDYGKKLLEYVQGYGGFVNAHAHPDRATTNNLLYWQRAGIDPYEAATYPLSLKQSLTGELHQGEAYTAMDLEKRMTTQFDRMIDFFTKEVTILIDATPDIELIAIDTAIKVRKKFADRINIRIGTQPIFGFKDPKQNPDRWEVFKKASSKVEVIGGLPEKDDSVDRIGFDEHLRMILKLGIELRKEVHVHVDQGNDPRENGTETLIEAVRWLGSPKVSGNNGKPTVWAVHSISPSCYEENRFKKLLANLKEYNIGIICCPRAAISMRQLRPFSTPIHNSMARLLEMIKHEIPIMIGTDNIADVFVPTGNANMIDELILLADILRYYTPELWAKIGCNEPLNNMNRELVSRALSQDSKVFRDISSDFTKT
ncbi:MAG: hypothetical protein ABIH48_02230 [Candidatus Falkowbacteria bacterium]